MEDKHIRITLCELIRGHMITIGLTGVLVGAVIGFSTWAKYDNKYASQGEIRYGAVATSPFNSGFVEYITIKGKKYSIEERLADHIRKEQGKDIANYHILFGGILAALGFMKLEDI